MRFIHQNAKKYRILVGIAAKKRVPMLRILRTEVANSTIPAPNTPANPVPDPKYPTTVLGKPLQNPRVVLSPNALTTPRMTEANNER